MKMFTAMFSAMLSLCSIVCAHALEAADTAGATYPDPTCARPAIPRAATSATDESEVSQYNMRVRRYNQDMVAYNACMRAYVEKANADIKHIQEKANSDLARIRDTANGSIQLIEGKIHDAIRVGNGTPDAPVTRSTRIGGEP